MIGDHHHPHIHLAINADTTLSQVQSTASNANKVAAKQTASSGTAQRGRELIAKQLKRLSVAAVTKQNAVKCCSSSLSAQAGSSVAYPKTNESTSALVRSTSNSTSARRSSITTDALPIAVAPATQLPAIAPTIASTMPWPKEQLERGALLREDKQQLCQHCLPQILLWWCPQ